MDFDFAAAEVDQQAQFLMGGAQIALTLRNFYAARRGDHLEFDDDVMLDQTIGVLFGNDHIVAVDDHALVLGNARARLSGLVSTGVVVDLRNESVPRMIRSVTGASRRASPSSIYIPLNPP